MAQVRPRPILTVAAALFTLADDGLNVVLQARDHEPFKGRLALIGGYVHADEDADATAAMARILDAKAGLKGMFLEQLATFSGPQRDPRGWSACIAYYALASRPALAQAEGSQPITLAPVDALPELPFDHARIVQAALARLRRKGAYSTLPALLLPQQFTFPELKAIYEQVLGVALNDSAFRRKISDLKIIEPVPDAMAAATAQHKRPAQLYRLAREGLAEFERTI